jgi:hypothetical protein
VVKVRSFAVVGAALASCLVACQIIAGIDRVEKDPPVVDAAPEAGADPCPHAVPPPAPATDDDPSGAIPPIYLAVRVFGDAKPGANGVAGFDLDGVCSCDLQPSTAHGGASSCAPKSTDCDEEGGVDNQASKLFGQLAPEGVSLNTLANGSIDQGARTLLFYVSGYNGKPNDQAVTVGAMLTNGIIDGSGCGTAVNPANGLAPPGWCGKDLWSFAADAVKPGTHEPTATGKGYVTGGVLVFTSDLPLSMYLGGGTIAIGSPTTAGKIGENDAGHWALEGTFAGRMVASDLIDLLGNYDTKDDDGGSGLCQSAFFATVKGAICTSVDVARLPGLDFRGGDCDALSIAIGFEAEQVAIGARRDAPKPSGPCAVTRLPPGAYTCP